MYKFTRMVVPLRIFGRVCAKPQIRAANFSIDKSIKKNADFTIRRTPADPQDLVSENNDKLNEFLRSGGKQDSSKISLWDLEKKDAVPGLKDESGIPTVYETGVGWARYEAICELEGKDPWQDDRAIPIISRPTPADPIRIKGVDPVFYIGCSGYPADTHELLWLTLSPHGQLDRCPQCGNCFQYTQIKSHDHH